MRSFLRKSSIGEVGALLLPARYLQAAPACNIPVCTRCGVYCRVELVEHSKTMAKVLVTCRSHKGPGGNDAEQLVTFTMVDSDWDEDDLGRCIRGVHWFEDSIRHEDFAGVE